MRGIRILILGVALLTASCSVISKEMRTQAVSSVPFRTLAYESDRYAGRTVILGGYILETRNLPDKTVIEVLQAPLGYRDAPKSRDLSEGRLIIYHKGFLDPEVFSKDRRITVAGRLTGCSTGQVVTCEIESREIHLWSEYEYRYPYYYDYYPYYPYYGYSGGPVLHPYRHHRYRHHHLPHRHW